MKVLHVITSLHIGGAEKLLVNLLPRFAEHGIHVDLLIFDGSVTPFKQSLLDAGIKIYEFNQGGSVYNPLHIIRLIPFMRRYDIVHTHNTAPQLFAAIAGLLGHAQLVTTEHSSNNRRRKWRWYRFIDRWMYSRYKRIVCISDKATENLQHYLKLKLQSHIITIYNGIDIAMFHMAKPSTQYKKYCANGFCIVMVAAFREEKDQDTLIYATALLPNRFHTFFIGDGVRKVECEQLVKKLGIDGRIHFLGNRMDIPELLQAANYVVMSSHWEGLSLSSIEGMSVGKPFLASDVDGLHEIVNGYGLLFKEGDARELAKQILYLEDNPKIAKHISDACFQKASQYDLSITVEKYMQLYDELYFK